MLDILTPGAYVRHPDQPEWGIGQVQSVVDGRITVNFEDGAKRLILSREVTLEPVDPATFGPQDTP